VSHFVGKAASPTASATTPPAMAQVVSRSPNPMTVDHIASTKSPSERAADQSANGTVSDEMT